MKESSFLDTKMVVYYREVRQLEDKFDGLEINHIPKCLNEAADTLAKMPISTGSQPDAAFSSASAASLRCIGM